MPKERTNQTFEIPPTASLYWNNGPFTNGTVITRARAALVDVDFDFQLHSTTPEHSYNKRSLALCIRGEGTKTIEQILSNLELDARRILAKQQAAFDAKILTNQQHLV